jgi:hypothetical protein
MAINNQIFTPASIIEAYLCSHFAKFPSAPRDSFPTLKNCFSYYGNSAQIRGAFHGHRAKNSYLSSRQQNRPFVRLLYGTNTVCSLLHEGRCFQGKLFCEQYSSAAFCAEMKKWSCIQSTHTQDCWQSAGGPHQGSG